MEELCIPCEPKKENKCPHGKRKSRCVDCGGSAICEHKKIKIQCKECGGSQICIHKKLKTICKECGGGSLCEHNKKRSVCKECGGGSFCEHNKLKTQCKECGGSQICEHNRYKAECKECGGSQICEHNKNRKVCIECKGASICEHSRRRTNCKECNGTNICPHDKIKQQCKECGGSRICIHNIQISNCFPCNGSNICVHNKRKEWCKECGGSSLCKSSWCDKKKQNKYQGHCLTCFIHLFPDEPNTRNYKTKEKDIVDRIKLTFSDFTWVADKKVQDGCSKRRPDLLLDMGSHIIIVEIDENKHTNYDCSCEHKRLMELSQDLQHRPIVFIRFNPDDYTNQDGVLVKSCWKLNKLGVIQISKTKLKEWEERIATLKQQIQYWIDNPTEKTIEIIELFY